MNGFVEIKIEDAEPGVAYLAFCDIPAFVSETSSFPRVLPSFAVCAFMPLSGGERHWQMVPPGFIPVKVSNVRRLWLLPPLEQAKPQ